MASTTPLRLESRSPSPNGTSSQSQAEQQHKRPNFGDMQDIVTFAIGPAKKEFVIHKSFVCHTSTVLKAVFNSNFAEGQTQRYVLEDTTEAAFRHFSEWVYTRNIYWDGKIKDDPISSILPRVWVLAEKFLVPKLQNRVVDLIEEVRKKRGPLGRTISWVYANTRCGSPLRRIYVHQWAWNVNSEELRRTDISFSTDFLIDLAAFLSDLNMQRPKFSRNMEDFYVKEDRERKA